MKLRVVSLGGAVHELTANPEDTLEHFKDVIGTDTQIPPTVSKPPKKKINNIFSLVFFFN